MTLALALAAALIGCGGDVRPSSARSTAERSTAPAQRSAPTALRYRLVKKPLVVYAGLRPAPNYQFRVLLRFNRALPSGANRAGVTLDGQSDTPGLHREETRRPCYTQDFGAGDTETHSFTHPKDGQLMTVEARIRGNADAITERVHAKRITISEYSNDRKVKQTLRSFGCEPK